MLDLTRTFLDLGDATSRNLEFSHREDVFVSYGEETITESNLLEIRRRHPQLVRVRTFPKRQEATNGADWEWHLIGRKRTLKMRVQAKRVQSNRDLKVRHKVKSSCRQQRCLLVESARAAFMKPVYCIYCTEPQRNVWKRQETLSGLRGLETGCLLAGAEDVPNTTTKLDEIEEKCWPWHHLFTPGVMLLKELDAFALDAGEFELFILIRQLRQPLVMEDRAMEASEILGWNAPTVDDLNEDTGRLFDRTGVWETSSEDLARLELDTDAGSEMASDGERLRELGMRWMMVMDVRGNAESDE